MKFSELVKLLKKSGFSIVKEKGSIRYYGKPGCKNLVRVDYHKRSAFGNVSCYIEISWYQKIVKGSYAMIDLPYSLVIEATEEPDFFGFYSPDLEGFSGVAPPSCPFP